MAATEAGLADGIVEAQGYAARFGALLRKHRKSAGLRLADLGRASAGTVTVADLRAVERGRRRLDVAKLECLAALYGLEVAEVVPNRHTVLIDLERGRFRIGDEVMTLPDTADPGTYLDRYVRLVNRLRAQPMRNPATLREDDTIALAEAFQLDTDEIVELLAAAIGRNAAARRRLTTMRGGGGTLAAVVVLGAAVVALPERDGSGDAGDAAATGEAHAPASTTEPGAEEPGGVGEPAYEPVELADSAAVAGPHPPAPLEDRPTEEAPAQQEPPGSPPGATNRETAASSSEGATGQAGPATEASHAAGGSGASTDTSADAEPIRDRDFDDETSVDAPDGPTVIEGGDHADDDAPAGGPVVDETGIDAPGGPTVIERDP